MSDLERSDVEFNEIKQIAEYDLKYNYVKNSKINTIETLLEELKKSESEINEIKIPYASHDEWGKLYKNRIDLDNSNGTFSPMGIIYEVLWGWNCVEEKKEFSNFKVTPLFDKVLFGGDWIYSLGRCRDDDEESYKVRGCIGTFTLVPAYFNGSRDGHANRNWENALIILKKGWAIESRAGKGFDKEKFSPSFEKEDYRSEERRVG